MGICLPEQAGGLAVCPSAEGRLRSDNISAHTPKSSETQKLGELCKYKATLIFPEVC